MSTSEQELFDKWLADQKAKARHANPLVPFYGEGPAGAICKNCTHLIRRGGCTRIYLKCDLRKNTRGPGTDHKARWPACGRFQPT